MKFTLESTTSVSIRSVSDQEIRIGTRSFSQPIAITTAGLLKDWDDKPIDALTADDFFAVFDEGPEIIVLGTGSTQVLPDRTLVFAMARRGIGFEVMHTRAAARTYNVLAAEHRRVAAVLYL